LVQVRENPFQLIAAGAYAIVEPETKPWLVTITTAKLHSNECRHFATAWSRAMAANGTIAFRSSRRE
jgi:hypothetical protein